MKRWLVAALSIVVAGILACDSGGVAGPAAGRYTLAAVLGTVDGPVSVPATIPYSANGDTLHVLAGSFSLGPGRSWRWQRSAEWISVGGREPQELELSGSYTASSQGHGVMLDLYPGQAILANIPGSAFIRHDSLFYGAGIFTRTQ